MGKKLARNQEIRQEVAIEWTRVLTRNITSPVQQARRRPLDTHLDEVSKRHLTSALRSESEAISVGLAGGSQSALEVRRGDRVI